MNALDPLRDLFSMEGGPSWVLALAAGLVLLFAGRKLYWFLSGVAGFVVGLVLARTLLGGEDGTLHLLAAIVLAAVAAMAAVFFQRVIIGVVGFLAGGFLLLRAAELQGWPAGWWIWAAAIVAGLIGAWLTRILFEVGLMAISALIGASFVVEAVGWDGERAGLALLATAAAGFVVQFVTSRGGRGARAKR